MSFCKKTLKNCQTVTSYCYVPVVSRSTLNRRERAEELWSSKPPPKLTDRVGCCQACVHGVQSSVDCCQTHALSPILVYWTPWSMSLTDDQFQFFCRNGAAIALSAKVLAMSECVFYRYRIVRAPHFTRISFVMCFGQIFDSFQYFWIRQPTSWIYKIKQYYKILILSQKLASLQRQNVIVNSWFVSQLVTDY